MLVGGIQDTCKSQNTIASLGSEAGEGVVKSDTGNTECFKAGCISALKPRQ